jgi:hypothetical protein
MTMNYAPLPSIDPILKHNPLASPKKLNMNHATLPVIQSLRTQSLAEFDPLYWEELLKMPLSYRVSATKLYERLRARCEKV